MNNIELLTYLISNNRLYLLNTLKKDKVFKKFLINYVDEPYRNKLLNIIELNNINANNYMLEQMFNYLSKLNMKQFVATFMNQFKYYDLLYLDDKIIKDFSEIISDNDNMILCLNIIKENRLEYLRKIGKEKKILIQKNINEDDYYDGYYDDYYDDDDDYDFEDENETNFENDYYENLEEKLKK